MKKVKWILWDSYIWLDWETKYIQTDLLFKKEKADRIKEKKRIDNIIINSRREFEKRVFRKPQKWIYIWVLWKSKFIPESELTESVCDELSNRGCDMAREAI